MAKQPPIQYKPASLSVPEMKAAIPKIQRRVDELEGFDLNAITARYDTSAASLVTKINNTLREILGHDSLEYFEFQVAGLDTLPLDVTGRGYSTGQVRAGYQKGIDKALGRLRTLRDLLQERIEDAAVAPPIAESAPTLNRAASRKVFVVHGRDNGTKETVARFLTQLQLEPIILHEQPNLGRTIVEKFEAHSDVGYAVVLFTPDDVGYLEGHPQDAKPRARQNVVYELGFFVGALKRTHVCVLHKGDIEMPSDFAGVAYVDLDAANAWKFLLAKEIRGAGVDVNMNLI